MAVAESSRETTAGTLRNAFGNVLSFFILLLIGVLAFSIRLFSVIKYESVIHEFDPYFNYRVTQFLTKNGVYDFWNWFDDRTWYPLGRVIGGTVYPGLTLTAGTLWWLLHSLNIPLSVESVCVFTAPIFSAFASWATYLLTKEVKGTGTGLTAAVLLAMVPSYISRSVAGSYDNEAVAIFALIFTFYLYIKTLNTGSLFYATLNALAYFYMVVLGTLLAALVPVVGFNAVMTSEHFASFLIFIIIHVVALVYHVKGILSPRMFKVAVMLVVSVGLVVCCAMVAVLVAVVASSPTKGWSGQSLSLLDPLELFGPSSGFIWPASNEQTYISLPVHCVSAAAEAYSAPSIVLTSYSQGGGLHVFDDFREAYAWLSHNTGVDDKVASWWDYDAMANRTVI
ncbi:hypothetical protein H0E87_012463, partial [Populus deltoides]